MSRHYSPAQRETLTRVLLAAAPDVHHVALSRQLGLSPEAVRRVRVGLMWAGVATDLPRLDTERITRTCRTCRLFDHDPSRFDGGQRCYGACSLGYPEAVQNINWARSCEAYARDPLATEERADG